MGCTASKLQNEDTVRRCKDRRRLMKDAVYARHHLAAAHSDYSRSLRLTGSALSTFAAGEPLSVSDHTPAVFLTSQQPRPPSPPAPPPPPRSPSPSPPPPPAAAPKLRRKPPAPKLPHILSDSSPGSSPRSQVPNLFPGAHSTYSSTPSQTSSVWNWENLYPPPPPPASDYFPQHDKLSQSLSHAPTQSQTQTPSLHSQRTIPQPHDTDSERSEYDYFDGKLHSHSPSHSHHLPDDYTETEREEVQCSEWGDHYSTTSSSDDDDDEVREDVESRSEIGTRSNFGSSVRAESVGAPVKGGVGGGFDAASSVAEMKMVVRHRDLKEIVEAIRENFDNAASAGDQVSEMLEIGKAQLDRSFRQLRSMFCFLFIFLALLFDQNFMCVDVCGQSTCCASVLGKVAYAVFNNVLLSELHEQGTFKTVYHSSSILSNLSSSWTSKPPLAVKYRLDASSLEEPSGSKSLCSTLERLLAWEKKLYDEVKAREGVKIEHEKKLSALQSQEYKGEDEAKIFKTKTSINRLQSLIVVTSQAVSTTSTEIIGLRDSDLVPQLVDLCHGFMYMWKSMHCYHEIQSNIVQQVRGLVNRSSRGDSTSELHRQATRDLESALSAWHSSFCRLIKFQRDFILSLHGWFKFSLLPVDNDNINNNSRENSATYHFFDEWKLALDRVPDTVASEAIKSFINVVHVISSKQAEELKIKKRTETASKELEKKASSLRNIERKFYNSYSMVGISLPDSAPDIGQGLDARDPLSEKKLELATCQRRVEDEMLKHSKAVEVTRAMTLNNLQTGLPGVFQALTSFSSLFTEALETVCTRSYAIK
ncbi:hypothetical protein Fmac_017651 [Flemingia macrophylla]|uniref:Uncharacterized protein n=1 Tax=Flemingia macrophylla TaxID=520843 RepID=A0ABD1M2R3_9FABA